MSTYLTRDLVVLDADIRTPEEAITRAGELLVEAGCVTEEYVTAMLDAFRNLGPYIVLAPHIAMPHARPELGGRRASIAVVRPLREIAFGHPDNDPVRLVVALAGSDDGTHLDMLRSIAQTLGSAQVVQELLTTTNLDRVVDLFTQGR